MSRWIRSTRIVCFVRALVSRLIGSTRIVCFFRALVGRWIRGVFLSSASEPLDLKQKIWHTYQRSFSPGSIYQPGLKMKSCPHLLAINTKHDRGGDEEQEYNNSGEEASQTSPEGKDRIQIIRIPIIQPNGAFDIPI